jgi:hypothetical protein
LSAVLTLVPAVCIHNFGKTKATSKAAEQEYPLHTRSFLAGRTNASHPYVLVLIAAEMGIDEG